MNMQVENRLPRPRSNVEHRPVSVLNIALAGNLCGHEVAAADDFGIGSLSLF